jgi:hypothetical protein
MPHLSPSLTDAGYVQAFKIPSSISYYNFMQMDNPEILIEEIIVNPESHFVLAGNLSCDGCGFEKNSTSSLDLIYGRTLQEAISLWLVHHSPTLSRLLNEMEKSRKGMAFTPAKKAQVALANQVVKKFETLTENPQAFVRVVKLDPMVTGAAFPLGTSFEGVKVFSGHFGEMPAIESETFALKSIRKTETGVGFSYESDSASVIIPHDIDTTSGEIPYYASNVRLFTSKEHAYRALLESTESLAKKIKKTMRQEGML